MQKNNKERDKNKLIETDSEIIQVIELAGKDIKTITNIFCMFKNRARKHIHVKGDHKRS